MGAIGSNDEHDVATVDVATVDTLDTATDTATDTAAATTATATADSDGRRARRERNREAVVDALLQFYREGHLQPSTDEIAARAGLSPRSLFRYFDDVDELCRIAINHQRDRLQHLFSIDVDPALPLRERAESFLDQRLALYEAQSGVGLVARARAPFQPLIADELRQGRAMLRGQIDRVFAGEIAALAGVAGYDGPHDGGTVARVVAAVDVLCSFESYRLLLDDHCLEREAVIDVMADGLVGLFEPDPAIAAATDRPTEDPDGHPAHPG